MKSIAKVCLYLFLVVAVCGFLFAVCGQLMTSNHETPEQARMREGEAQRQKDEADEKVGFLVKNRVLPKLQCDRHRAYMEPYFWRESNIDIKKGMLLTLARHCSQGESGTPWIELFDYKTGKRLGKYDVWGFTVD